MNLEMPVGYRVPARPGSVVYLFSLCANESGYTLTGNERRWCETTLGYVPELVSPVRRNTFDAAVGEVFTAHFHDLIFRNEEDAMAYVLAWS